MYTIVFGKDFDLAINDIFLWLHVLKLSQILMCVICI
jgi:hypothetical protein